MTLFDVRALVAWYFEDKAGKWSEVGQDLYVYNQPPRKIRWAHAVAEHYALKADAARAGRWNVIPLIARPKLEDFDNRPIPRFENLVAAVVRGADEDE